MICQICNTMLAGKQAKYCSTECKHRSTNIVHQTYANQKRRGLDRKIALVKLHGGCCLKCSYKKNLASLDFHHRNPEEKSFDINIRKCSNSTWEALLNEATKCDVLCSNCHGEYHYPDLNDLL